MTRLSLNLALATLFAMTAACGDTPTAPSHPDVISATPSGVAVNAGPPASSAGPEVPPFNIEVVLRPVGGAGGFGLVKFRQPNDGMVRVLLGTWVRDLAPNSAFYLQRAVDTTLNGDCTSTAWLTLGAGTVVQPIVTDARGTGRADFYRDLPPSLAWQRFDIHFRIISAAGAEVLHSACYQYVAEPD